MITPYLYVPFVAWILAQAIKMIIEIIKGDVDLRYLYASGGMPSSHAAVVCSLAAYTLLHEGIASPLFGITAIIAAIVMYDSFGVRRSAGEQAKILNKLVSDLANDGNLRKPDDYNKLREILGHQPLEVIIGAVLGLAVAALFSLDKLSNVTAYLTTMLTPTEVYIVAGFAITIIIVPLILFFVLKKFFKKNPKLASLYKYFLGGNVIIGMIYLVAALIGREQIIPYGQRWVTVVIKSVWLIFMGLVIWRFAKIRKVVRFGSVETRRDAWLKRAGKKK